MLAGTTTLPLEVLMQVAEWISLQATSVAKAHILSLILACRHFHNLFLPILYRYIWILSFSSRPDPVRKLISALQNQTPSFRHTAVMYIIVYAYPSEDDLYTLLGLCTGLKGLCVHSPRPPPRNPPKYGDAITSTFPSLTRLHLVLDWYSSVSIFGRFAESYPINITTLTIDVASDDETLLRLDFGALFPSLRELGLKYHGFGQHRRASITHVVRTCPDSVTLIFLSGVNETERSLFDDDIRDDTRILWAFIPSLLGAEFSGAKQFLADVTGAPCWWSRARDAASRGERVVTLEIENTNVDGVIPLQTSSSIIGLRTGSTTGSFNFTPNNGASASSPQSNLTTNGVASGSGFNLVNGGRTSSSTAQQNV